MLGGDFRRTLGAGLAAVALASGLAPSGEARAQHTFDPSRFMARSEETRVAIEAVSGDGPAYSVSTLSIGYREGHPDLPPLGDLLPVDVVLTPTETGYVAPRPGQAEEVLRFGAETPLDAEFHASAIAAIGQALLHNAHEAGLLGVFVLPDPAQIEPVSEVDRRAQGDGKLDLQVWVGHILEVRTIAAGGRIPDTWRINNPKHRRVLQGSPLYPADAGRDDTTDLLLVDALEDYVHRLNRHPGRQVETALGPSENNDGISLDYRVYEPKSWIAYAQAANTGTQRTALWQTRFGYQNRQLTSRDDILSIEFLNAGGKDVNAVDVSYSAPWFSPVRPSWLKKKRRESKWIGWLNRNEIPWWGVDRLRWGVRGGWSRYQSNIIPDEEPTADSLVIANDWYAGGELSYNFFQHGALFIDTFGGLKLRGIDTQNQSLGADAQANGLILAPVAGFRLERVNLYSGLFASFSAEGGFTNLDSPAAGTGTTRCCISTKWAALEWDLGYSQYLEPLLNRKAWSDPDTPRSSTLAHEVALGFRGQYGFDYRLIPQASQVIGGLYSVRGFEQALAVGDSVYVGSAEYRFHIPRALGIQPRPVQLPLIGDFRVAPQQVYGRPDWDLVLRGFVDGGHTVRNRRSATPIDEFNQTLVGAGVGLELILGGKFRARADWGRGIYQVRDCIDQATCPAQPAIDKAGVFNFLFSVVY
jgi:hypothetical protein